MTTKELMVEDYITFSDVQNDSYCPKLKVVIIDKEDVYVSVDGDPVVDMLDSKDLAGIPLTPEILEKNGFGYIEKDENLSHYYLGEPHFCKDMNLHIGTDNTGRFWLNYYNNAIYGLRYVHQLQHAIRLCRIEKEIEL